MDPTGRVAAQAGGLGRPGRARAEAHIPPDPAHGPAPASDDARTAAHPHDAATGAQIHDDYVTPDRSFTRADEGRRARSGRDPGPRFDRIGEQAEDFVDTFEAAITSAVPKQVRLRNNPRQNTVVNVIWRALVLVVGLSLVCLGLVLLVLPGPGWGSILLGLVILASEYTWANRLVEPVRRRVKREASRVQSMSRSRRIAIYLAMGLSSVVFLVSGAWFLSTQTWSWPPW